MRSPSRMVGSIEPLGTTFQSAIALRNSTIRTINATRLLYSRHSRASMRIIALLETACLRKENETGRPGGQARTGPNAPAPACTHTRTGRDDPIIARTRPAASLAWKPETQCRARRIGHLDHLPRLRVRHDGTFEFAPANQFAEVRGLVVQAAAFERRIELDDASIDVAHRRARRVPPVLVNRDVTQRARDERIALAEQVQSAKELRDAVLVAAVEARERVDARPPEPS